jgi:glycosyltransferase involved in cell wall biosynthesis
MKNVVPVSVVIPYFNDHKVIARAIFSVLNQTATPLEIILVNDGCTGDERDLFESALSVVGNHANLRIIHLDANSGSSLARNLGWENARGDYVAFLDADDAWDPRKLEIQYQFMSTNPDIDLTGHLHHIILDGKFANKISSVLPPKITLISLYKLLIVNQFITPSVMLKRSYPLRFHSSQRYMEDYELWLSMAANGAKLVRLEVELASIFKLPFGVSGLSSNLIEMEKAELNTYRRLAKKHSLIQILLPILWAFSLIKFTRRWLIIKIRNSEIHKSNA